MGDTTFRVYSWLLIISEGPIVPLHTWLTKLYGTLLLSARYSRMFLSLNCKFIDRVVKVSIEIEIERLRFIQQDLVSVLKIEIRLFRAIFVFCDRGFESHCAIEFITFCDRDLNFRSRVLNSVRSSF